MKKTQYTSKFKFERVKETIEKNNVAEIARRYNMNPNLLSTWRKYFFDNAHEIFDKTEDREKKQLRGQVEKLERLVGKKEVELALMKNFFDHWESQPGRK